MKKKNICFLFGRKKMLLFYSFLLAFTTEDNEIRIERHANIKRGDVNGNHFMSLSILLNVNIIN
jgi:hypothetical protein